MLVPIKDGYELYLEFGDISYLNDTQAVLKKALFYGPVLKQAQKINAPDSIMLDFTKQNFIFIDESFYVANLKWRRLRYHRNDVIELFDVILEHNKAGSLRSLSPDNFFIIDCEKHEERIHIHNLVYPAWVLNDDGYPLGLQDF
jgi:hypothetical protein